MLTSSAALALVLQCAITPHLSPLNSAFDTHSSLKLDASGIHGDVSPCPELPARSAVRNMKPNEPERRAFSNDLVNPAVTTLHLAEADLDQQIVPGMAQSFPARPAPAAPQSAPTPQPTYESWDVLRQYPRAAPLTPPAVPAAKPSDTPNTSKESTDEKAAKRTPAPEQN